MPFDMQLENLHEKIGYSEQAVFIIIYQQEGFLNTKWLWDVFYASPIIDADKSKALAEELIAAKTIHKIKRQKSYLQFIDRIVPFFEKSYSINKPIKCLSD